MLQALERIARDRAGHQQLISFGAVPWLVKAISLEQVLPLDAVHPQLLPRTQQSLPYMTRTRCTLTCAVH